MGSIAPQNFWTVSYVLHKKGSWRIWARVSNKTKSVITFNEYKNTFDTLKVAFEQHFLIRSFVFKNGQFKFCQRLEAISAISSRVGYPMDNHIGYPNETSNEVPLFLIYPEFHD